MKMKYKLLIAAGALGVTGAAIGGGLYLAYPVQVSMLAGLTHNYLVSWPAPPGAITTESNAAYKASGAVASSAAAKMRSPNTAGGDWPSYTWAGWLYAADADTGVWKWRVKSNYPIVGAVTATAGGVVFFGDVGGNFYALNSSNGEKLWAQDFGGGGIAGAVMTYRANGAQKAAAAAGFTNLFWPTKVVKAKIVVLGLEGGGTTSQ